jgi:hypothetical protein
LKARQASIEFLIIVTRDGRRQELASTYDAQLVLIINARLVPESSSQKNFAVDRQLRGMVIFRAEFAGHPCAKATLTQAVILNGFARRKPNLTGLGSPYDRP